MLHFRMVGLLPPPQKKAKNALIAGPGGNKRDSASGSKQFGSLLSFNKVLEILVRLEHLTFKSSQELLDNENSHLFFEISIILVKVYLYHLYSLPTPVTLKSHRCRY